MCETRWVLRHDRIKSFKEIFVSIVNALENLEKLGHKGISNITH